MQKKNSKINASRLAALLPSILHPAQSEFFYGRSMTLNIRKVLIALKYATAHPQQDIASISLDAGKAVNNIRFSWLFMVMKHFGFSGPILDFAQRMYVSPTACLVTPDFISPVIPLSKGTHYGCLLFSLLFNITMEPLSRILNSDEGISGVPIGNKVFSLSYICGWRIHFFLSSFVRHSKTPKPLHDFFTTAQDCG